MGHLNLYKDNCRKKQDIILVDLSRPAYVVQKLRNKVLLYILINALKCKWYTENLQFKMVLFKKNLCLKFFSSLMRTLFFYET